MKGRINDSDYQRNRSTSQSEPIFVGNVTEEKGKGKIPLAMFRLSTYLEIFL